MSNTTKATKSEGKNQHDNQIQPTTPFRSQIVLKGEKIMNDPRKPRRPLPSRIRWIVQKMEPGNPMQKCGQKG